MRGHLLLIILFISAFTYGQIGGKTIFNFLNLAVSAKQAALGGKIYTGLKSDIFQPAFNPATLNTNINGKLGLNYTDYLSDINYGNVAYAPAIKKIGTLYFALSYINYGSFTYADENGNRTGQFGASEGALITGYAYHFPQSNWHAGLNMKFVLSSLENYSSTAIIFDLGILYQNSEKGLNFGLVARNAGFQLSTYQGQKEDLPLELGLTFSKTFKHAPFKWFISFENLQITDLAFNNPAHNIEDPNGNIITENTNFADEIFRHTIISVELFPRKKFNLRAGYNFRRSAELSQKDERFGSGLNFGFSLQLRKVEINYAYSNYNYAAGANFVSLTLNLNEL